MGAEAEPRDVFAFEQRDRPGFGSEMGRVDENEMTGRLSSDWPCAVLWGTRTEMHAEPWVSGTGLLEDMSHAHADAVVAAQFGADAEQRDATGCLQALRQELLELVRGQRAWLLAHR